MMNRIPKTLRWVISIAGVLLLVFTLMRFGLYFAFNKQGNSFSDLFDAFWLGLRFDLRVVAIISLVILILTAIPALNPFKRRGARTFWNWFIFILCFALLLFYVADFAHYAYLTQRLNASVLNYLEDAAISMKMVWQSYPVIWLILALVAGSFLLGWIIKRIQRRIEQKPNSSDRRTGIISVAVVVVVFAFLIFGKFDQYPLRWSDAFNLGSDYKAGLALNPFESFFNTLSFRHKPFDEKKVRESYPLMSALMGVNSTTDTVLNFNRRINVTKTDSTPPLNVILVICESFSSYKSTVGGNRINTTPFFDKMAKGGIFFDHCFTPSYGTARGVWATLTGTPDVSMPQTASRNPAAVDQHTIINDFNGYEKFYFIGGSPSWANIRGLLMNNIKDLQLYDEQTLNVPKVDVWGVSDKNLFLEANKILAAKKSPFFAVIQTADNHRPYTIPEEDQQEFKKLDLSKEEVTKNGFESIEQLNAFRYTDFCFQKFIEAAEKENYFSNTVFVFVGDHGLPGDPGDIYPKAWSEQRLAVNHVPLLFYSPSKLAPKRIDSICSQIDVIPTIAGLCKISYTNTTLGRDLLSPDAGPGLAFIFDGDFIQVGILKDSVYFRKQLKTGKEELVSIKNNSVPRSDPSELRKLSEAYYETSRWLLLNNKKR